MLKNSYKMLFLYTLFLGTLISISSNSWFSIWMGLEINLLSFIPLTMKHNNLYSSEASLKYFLTQALASSLLLFSIIFFYMFYLKFNLMYMTFMNMMFSSILMMKMGMAPFHFWFPIVMEGLNWMNNIILMTWQKLAPLILISYCMNFYFFIFSILLSTIFGAMGGLNQTSLRKLMAFSSINHLSWLVAGIMNSQNIWKIYFFLYCLLSLSVILIFNNFKLFNLNQIFSILNYKNLIKTIIFIPLLSLGGLPPFTGFFTKWIIIEHLMSMNLMILLLIMIYFTLVTLFFYLRISYSAILLNYNEMSWHYTSFFNLKNFYILMILNFISIFGLSLINMLFYFL
uniref:NADH dehydrogenase subunit 2 n=1 Tax=Stictochironomus rosenschoeldi TaxID=2578633 RepID=UPI0023EF6E5A|nr:NADH dehydrogenase subunit 2 [Stictochironomus rosenschoeldi]WEF49717.1 NADH dehydrogenase subunit 2 [Stictochironomus rosenschoeldi]